MRTRCLKLLPLTVKISSWKHLLSKKSLLWSKFKKMRRKKTMMTSFPQRNRVRTWIVATARSGLRLTAQVRLKKVWM